MSKCYFVYIITQGGMLMFGGEHETKENAQNHIAELGTTCVIVEGAV